MNPTSDFLHRPRCAPFVDTLSMQNIGPRGHMLKSARCSCLGCRLAVCLVVCACVRVGSWPAGAFRAAVSAGPPPPLRGWDIVCCDITDMMSLMLWRHITAPAPREEHLSAPRHPSIAPAPSPHKHIFTGLFDYLWISILHSYLKCAYYHLSVLKCSAEHRMAWRKRHQSRV